MGYMLMKILFVTQTTPDGLSDIVYSGLKKMSNVSIHEYPFKTYYHANLLPYELNGISYDSVPVPKPSWLKQNHTIEKTYDNASEIDLDDYDYVVLSTLQKEIDDLIYMILNRAGEKLIFLDGDDSPFYRLLIRQTKFYFKREKYTSPVISSLTMGKYQYLMWYYRARNSVKDASWHTFPIPQIAIPPKRSNSLNFTVLHHEYKKENDKDIDVSLIGRLTNWSRIKFVNKLKLIGKTHGLNICVNNKGVSPEEYVSIIQRSKIAISLPGAGYDTFRYWEIPYYGTCLLSQRLPIEIQDNFINGVSALFFNGERDMEQSILQALKGDHYEEIAKNGKVFFEKYHTDVKRAGRLLEVLEGNS